MHTGGTMSIFDDIDYEPFDLNWLETVKVRYRTSWEPQVCQYVGTPQYLPVEEEQRQCECTCGLHVTYGIDTNLKHSDWCDLCE